MGRFRWTTAVLAFALLWGLVAGVGSAGAAPVKSHDWSKRMAAAERYANKRTGTISFSVRAPGLKRSRDGDRSYHAASTVKALMMLAYLRQRSERGLSKGEKERLRIMIRRSNDGAASEVQDLTGNGAIQALADKIGMPCFRIMDAWGTSPICSRDMAQMMVRYRKLLPRRHEGFAMRQLESIVKRQRWGIPEAVGRRWTPYFKGGWYEGLEGWRTHQIAVLEGPKGKRVALAILTYRNPSRGYGRATIEGIAERLVGPITNGR